MKRYAISYHGKVLGEGMDLETAEGMLKELSYCFKGLELAESRRPTEDQEILAFHIEQETKSTQQRIG
jgi:hypothetical protein